MNGPGRTLVNHPLWPDGVEANGHSSSDRRYLVVPSLDDPRLVLPTRPRKSGARIVRALRNGSSMGARARTTAMNAATLVNLRSHTLPTPSLFEVVAGSLGGSSDDFAMGVHLGPPRANRKPVLAIADSRGKLVAFAKYGVDALTDQLVGREAATLAELSELVEHQRIVNTRVPRLIAHGTHDGHQYVVQAPVPTTPRARNPQAVVASQTEIALLRRDFDQASAAAAIRAQWLSRAQSTGDPSTTAFAEIALAWCTEVQDAALEWGSWHGDWRTTNMAITPAGCSVWDWERFAEGVPVGYDALHLFLTNRQASVRDLSGLPHDVRENAARVLRPFGVTDRRAVELTVTGYLLELAGRYLDDDQAQAGARLGAVGQWLLPHLAGSAPRPHTAGRKDSST
ncbi:MAG: hypothetical protein ACJ74E_07290 [Actinomycetes bacterium]